VFLCDLDKAEKIGLMAELRGLIHHEVDSIVFIDLGEPGRVNSAGIQYLGERPHLPSAGPTII
jgi:CRISPR-associated protein Cas2